MLTLTLKQLEAAQKAALDSLVDKAGSYTHLAKMLKYNPMVVKGWVIRGRVSKGGAKRIAKHPTFADDFPTSITRPDL